MEGWMVMALPGVLLCRYFPIYVFFSLLLLLFFFYLFLFFCNPSFLPSFLFLLLQFLLPSFLPLPLADPPLHSVPVPLRPSTTAPLRLCLHPSLPSTINH